MKQNVVLYPGSGVGHLNPMVELAKVFLHHGLGVTMACIEPPGNLDVFHATIARVSASNPAISFHVLPTIPLDSSLSDPFVSRLTMLAGYNDHLRDFLRSLPSVHAIILDMFCVDALDIAAELNIPAYFFFASGASNLASFMHLPFLDASLSASFGELGKEPIDFPGLPPIPASHLPIYVLLERDNQAHQLMIKTVARLPEANGILENTFESLEINAVKALRDGLCVPGKVTPPVYCIGPLVGGADEKKKGGERPDCLLWLDQQPEKSVVFLCFGSMGSFPVEQLKEMAVGLEKSGQRFLWVVRSPRDKDPKKYFDTLPEPDLEVLLPKGFLERTKDRGMVLKSWAPQVEVLQHKATGAFVTHCGWNSTLEGLTAGLPLVCWPLYAEQKMNKIFLVEEIKAGLELKGYDEELVKADEVEKKVRMVMESDEGKKLRERTAALKAAAAEAIKEGGPSYSAFVEFLKDVDNFRGIARG